MILTLVLETALSRDCSSQKYLYSLELFKSHGIAVKMTVLMLTKALKSGGAAVMEIRYLQEITVW